jgi:hypothetical protein
MPRESARVNTSMEVESQTDIPVLKPYALDRAVCLANVSRQLETHDVGTSVLLHMRANMGFDKLVASNRRL